METIDDIGFGGLKLIQDKDAFRYGIDAVLLADFAKHCSPRSMQAAELGCGNGIVSFLLAQQQMQRLVTGIDFQENAISLARRSCELNGMTDRVSFLHCDIKELTREHPALQGTCDLVVSNPPYIEKGSGLVGSSSPRQAARQETTADLDDFIRAAAWLLQGKGSFCLVHRPFRLVDIFTSCRKHRLEPKRIRFVHPKEGEPPNIVLIHCVFGGGRELRYDAPLNVYNGSGGYTDQILEIYGRHKTDYR